VTPFVVDEVPSAVARRLDGSAVGVGTALRAALAAAAGVDPSRIVLFQVQTAYVRATNAALIVLNVTALLYTTSPANRGCLPDFGALSPPGGAAVAPSPAAGLIALFTRVGFAVNLNGLTPIAGQRADEAVAATLGSTDDTREAATTSFGAFVADVWAPIAGLPSDASTAFDVLRFEPPLVLSGADAGASVFTIPAPSPTAPPSPTARAQIAAAPARDSAITPAAIAGISVAAALVACGCCWYIVYAAWGRRRRAAEAGQDPAVLSAMPIGGLAAQTAASTAASDDGGVVLRFPTVASE
jgi:hypothetical protein